jgi:hypothetical protein
MKKFFGWLILGLIFGALAITCKVMLGSWLFVLYLYSGTGTLAGLIYLSVILIME